MGDVTGLTGYAYDAAGRQTEVALPLGNFLTYAYDPVGNRSTLLDQSSGTTTYSYDARNQLTGVLNPFAETTTWTWDTLGRQQQQVLANGVAASYAYDAGGRASDLAYYQTDGTPVAMYTATYDAAGNRTGVDELEGSFAYGYDASNQLLTEARTGSNAYAYTYTYDGVGNRLTLDESTQFTTYTYSAADELTLTDILGALTTYSYDANGNTLGQVDASSLVTYTWDGENRLLAVEDDGGTETYTYAATGLRRSKVTDSGTTEFVWDGQNVLAELDESLADVARYTDWPGRWGGLSSARRSGSSQFFGFDLSANTRALLDASEAVTDSYLYSAFGPELVANATTNPMRFAGQVGYYCDLAGWLYVRARHLHVSGGRWLARDPLASAQAARPHGLGLLGTSVGASPYGYVLNGPVSRIDPAGLAHIACQGGVGLPGIYPDHCWIQFTTKPCAVGAFPPGHSNYGPQWRWGFAGDIDPNKGYSEDFSQRENCVTQSELLEDLLCECINESQQNLPPYTLPKWILPGLIPGGSVPALL